MCSGEASWPQPSQWRRFAPAAAMLNRKAVWRSDANAVKYRKRTGGWQVEGKRARQGRGRHRTLVRYLQSYRYGGEGLRHPEIRRADSSSGEVPEKLLANGGARRELGTQTPLELLTHFGDFHAGHNDEFTRKHLARLVVVGELAGHAAILAVLIPAKAAARNGVRANEMAASEQRVALGYLKLLTHDGDFDELFVGAKGFRHGVTVLCKRCGADHGMRNQSRAIERQGTTKR